MNGSGSGENIELPVMTRPCSQTDIHFCSQYYFDFILIIFDAHYYNILSHLKHTGFPPDEAMCNSTKSVLG